MNSRAGCVGWADNGKISCRRGSVADVANSEGGGTRAVGDIAGDSLGDHSGEGHDDLGLHLGARSRLDTGAVP